MSNIVSLKDEAKIEIYNLIDQNIRPLPKSDDGQFDEFQDGFIDNDVDALRHAYVSGVYTIEYGEDTANILGRLNELFNLNYSEINEKSQNMDLWNNAVGRKYGKKAKNRKDLFNLLMKALESKELIISQGDERFYASNHDVCKATLYNKEMKKLLFLSLVLFVSCSTLKSMRAVGVDEYTKLKMIELSKEIGNCYQKDVKSSKAKYKGSINLNLVYSQQSKLKKYKADFSKVPGHKKKRSFKKCVKKAVLALEIKNELNGDYKINQPFNLN